MGYWIGVEHSAFVSYPTIGGEVIPSIPRATLNRSVFSMRDFKTVASYIDGLPLVSITPPSPPTRGSSPAQQLTNCTIYPLYMINLVYKLPPPSLDILAVMLIHTCLNVTPFSPR